MTYGCIEWLVIFSSPVLRRTWLFNIISLINILFCWMADALNLCLNGYHKTQPCCIFKFCFVCNESCTLKVSELDTIVASSFLHNVYECYQILYPRQSGNSITHRGTWLPFSFLICKINGTNWPKSAFKFVKNFKRASTRFFFLNIFVSHFIPLTFVLYLKNSITYILNILNINTKVLFFEIQCWYCFLNAIRKRTGVKRKISMLFRIES